MPSRRRLGRAGEVARLPPGSQSFLALGSALLWQRLWIWCQRSRGPRDQAGDKKTAV